LKKLDEAAETPVYRWSAMLNPPEKKASATKKTANPAKATKSPKKESSKSKKTSKKS